MTLSEVDHWTKRLASIISRDATGTLLIATPFRYRDDSKIDLLLSVKNQRLCALTDSGRTVSKLLEFDFNLTKAQTGN
jgi:hypothetical protein